MPKSKNALSWNKIVVQSRTGPKCSESNSVWPTFRAIVSATRTCISCPHPVAVHQMCNKLWYKSRSRQTRGRASYSESCYRGTKGWSNPYNKVGGCASALASEFTEIAVQLKNSPDHLPTPPPNLRFHIPFPNQKLTLDVDVWNKVENKVVVLIYFENKFDFSKFKVKKKR